MKCHNPFKIIYDYFESIIYITGLRLFFLIGIVQLFIKGIQYTIVLRCLFPILSQYGIHSTQLQLYSVIVGTPWTFKPVIGIISDLFPLFGYHKRYYHLIFTSISSFISLILAITNSNDPVFITFVFFIYSYETVVLDLLTESKCNELMRDCPSIRNNISTYIQLMNTIGGLIMISIFGPLFDHIVDEYSSDDNNDNEINFVIFYWIAFVVSIIPIFTFRWYNELYVEYPYRKCYERIITFDYRKWSENKNMFILITIVAISGPLAALFSGLLSIYVGIVFSISMLSMSILGTYFTMPNILFKVIIFIVLIGTNKPYLGTALDYFYTATPECFPNGIHFDYTYYITWTGIIGYLAQLVGIIFYRLCLTKLKFRTVLCLTFIFSSIGGLTDLAMILRWNTIFGIPDKYFYIFASAMMGNLSYILWYIPVLNIISIVSPIGLESTIFAFIIGIYNFADQLNYINGSLLYEIFGITCTCSNQIISFPEVSSITNNGNSSNSSNNICNFDNLWILVLFSYIISPLLIGIPATFLIPNVNQDENLIPIAEPEIYTTRLSRDSEYY